MMSSDDKQDMEGSDADESSSSSEEEPEEVIRSRVPALATTRERRANAGSKMSSLIQNYAALTQTEDNEFYASAYGGFAEDGDDVEFNEDMEEADDELDSDFDAEEVDDEPVADADDEEEGKKRQRSRKSAKEGYEITARRRDRQRVQQQKKPESKAKVTKPKPAVVTKKPADPVTRAVVEEVLGKRSLRERKPIRKEDDEELHVKKPSSSRRRSRKKVPDEKKTWTQEELLEEAKETERENLASLHKYQLLELERSEAKKRAKKSSREMTGPFIRFLSTSMPLVSDQATSTEGTGSSKVERTFITFSDEQTMAQAFRPTPRRKTGPSAIRRGTAICPISNLRARYFDPVTQMPYASSTTFRALREAYTNQLEAIYGNIVTRPSVSQSAPAEADPASPHKSQSKKSELEVWLDWKRAQRRVDLLMLVKRQVKLIHSFIATFFLTSSNQTAHTPHGIAFLVQIVSSK